jgi:signal transduction histidine kinase
VTFDAELRAYLEGLERRRFDRSHACHIDERALRAHFLSRLGELEGLAPSGSVTAASIAATFNEWSPRIDRVARYIEGLSNDLVAPAARTPLEFAKRLLDVAIGLNPTDLGLVEHLEIARLLAVFRADSLSEIESYTIETRLVEEEPSIGRNLTALGSAFLRLRGKDAIRWLLTIEVLQSTGHADPWRTSRVLLEVAADNADIDAFFGHDLEYVFPFSRESLERLSRMGVLLGVLDHEDGGVYRYRVAPGWQETIDGVLGTGPWHQAITAVLSEDRTGLVSPTRAATEGVVEQAKMIAHEVRNALVPARIQLDALRVVVPSSQMGRVDAARRGVTRVLTFVEEMVAANELVTELVTACELGELVREAIGWLEGGDRILVLTAPTKLRVRAPRARLARAISNILRNALQVTQETQEVRIAVHDRDGRGLIAVDDAGPGVPDDARERVFQEGYTTRTDGSGYGLAYVRRVVVDGLRGRVWCEASDLGGARFVIEIPEVEVEP